ncbi:Sorting nexin, partial [Caligus rogercresseyi]
GYDQDDWDSDFDDPQTYLRPPTIQTPVGRMAVAMGAVEVIGHVQEQPRGIQYRPQHFTNFNRFSSFVKSGTENYILGKSNFKVDDIELVSVS